MKSSQISLLLFGRSKNPSAFSSEGSAGKLLHCMNNSVPMKYPEMLFLKRKALFQRIGTDSRRSYRESRMKSKACCKSRKKATRQ